LSNNGTLLALTKYKEIKNFMEITPHARDDGYIYLMIKGGVASFNPTGVLQIPGITSRDIDIGGVYLKKGETLILGGFRVDHNLAVERKEPFLSKMPIIKYIIPWAKDKERSMNEILFIVTPHYADVSQGSKKQEENFFNYKPKRWILEDIVDEGLERSERYKY
jgi:type II secretory pathway component GspD/PulD (secretin)